MEDTVTSLQKVKCPLKTPDVLLSFVCYIPEDVSRMTLKNKEKQKGRAALRWMYINLRERNTHVTEDAEAWLRACEYPVKHLNLRPVPHKASATWLPLIKRMNPLSIWIEEDTEERVRAALFHQTVLVDLGQPWAPNPKTDPEKLQGPVSRGTSDPVHLLISSLTHSANSYEFYISCGCRNKLPWTQWLKTIKFIIF